MNAHAATSSAAMPMANGSVLLVSLLVSTDLKSDSTLSVRADAVSATTWVTVELCPVVTVTLRNAPRGTASPSTV